MLECEKQVAALEKFVAEGEHRASVYGLQYGDLDFPRLRPVVDDWLMPAVCGFGRIAEIGVGGGRWVRRYSEAVEFAYLIDGTVASEAAVSSHTRGPFKFVVSPDGLVPSIPDGDVGYVFSFDTFVHFHAELFDAYVREVGRILKKGGLFHLHYSPERVYFKKGDGCFIRRSESDMAKLLQACGLETTGRAHEFPGGYGSMILELIKK